ncbi:MAG: hypothetical protein WBC91_03030 [Phototrophicaceae bacterium]
MDALHYFHYGQLVHNNEIKGEPRLLAKSSGITDAFIDLVLETAKVQPLPDSSGVSWGMLRTKRGEPLTFARAEQHQSGAVIYQFIQISAEAVRELAGNLSALSAYLTTPLPTYAMLGDALDPIIIADAHLTTEMQVDYLLDLMSYARNNTRNIQPLVAAIVSGTPLIIINAPKDGDARLGFVQGLLMLLPASTRLGVTFLLHAEPDTKLRAQVLFMDTPPTDDNQVIYDWETAAVSGKEIKNDYSRFVTSQMRLDPELVIREAEKLTSTAGWRFNNGDNLAAALDYASHRAKVDASLENGMPVEVSSVAKILLEDITLSDQQRMMYSRHLINFSLALDDLQFVDSIMATMNQHQEIEDEVFKYMSKALEEGQGATIFETLVRWQENPFSPTGRNWQQLLAKAALSELDDLIEDQDAEMISDYLDDVQALGKQATPIIGRVIDRVLPLADRDPSIPTKILLLAMQNLDDTKLQSLMSTPRFIRPLPSDVKRMLALFAQRDRKAPPGTMIRAIQGIPASERTDALIVFVKQAYTNQRIDLIDERVLSELVKALNINPTLIDGNLLTGIAESIQTNTLSSMKRPAPRLILQLLLLSQNYIALDTLMIAQSRDIYGASGQRDYIQSIQETFAKTNLSSHDAIEIFQTFDDMEMNELPMIAAILGALEGTSWSADLKQLSDRAMQAIGDDQRILEALPAQSLFSLLQYTARQGDPRRMRVATRIMGSCAAHENGKSGLTATNHAYKLLDSSSRTRPYAIEVVRQYVREAEEKPARHMIKFYGDRLGDEIATKLQVSYEFSNLIARMDWLTYASSLHLTVNLLQSMVNAYSDSSTQPNLGDVRLLAEHFRKALSVGEHRVLSEDLRKLAHAIVVLGQRHDRRSSNNDKHIEAVARGKNNPRSILDVFRASGGYLLDSAPYPFRTQAGDPHHPMGDESPEDLHVTIAIASTLLDVATNARPSSRDLWTTEALVDEIQSQTATLVGEGAKNLQQMGRNWQRLSDLVTHITQTGNAKVIEVNNSTGRKLEKLESAPQNTLELMRSIYGYFAQI